MKILSLVWILSLFMLTFSLSFAQDKIYRNSIGVEFVLIPSGSFTMGVNNNKAAANDETPPHQVHVSQSFYMGKYEVTQSQWMKVMGSNPSRFKAPTRPVEGTSWEDVQVFIKKLNQMEEGGINTVCLQKPNGNMLLGPVQIRSTFLAMRLNS